METEWKTKMELSTYLHEWITQMTEVKGKNIPDSIFGYISSSNKRFEMMNRESLKI